MEWSTKGGIKFKELKIGQQFDCISPNVGHNSFFETCEKISTRKYKSVSSGIEYQVGSINAIVYHVK